MKLNLFVIASASCVFLLSLPPNALAGDPHGIYQDFVIWSANGGGNQYYHGGAGSVGISWDGADLGTFCQDGDLKLQGAEINTFDGGSECANHDRIYESHFFYRIYKEGTTPPELNAISLDFRGRSGNNVKWDQTTQNINLLFAAAATGNGQGTYVVEVYFRDSDSYNCTGTYYDYDSKDGNNFKATFVFNPSPSITLGTSPSIPYGSSSAELPYSATENGANQYLVTFDSTAHSAGFSDTVFATLPTTPILISVPDTAPAGIYNGLLTVRNSSSSCDSSGVPFTVTITRAEVTNVVSSSANPSLPSQNVTFTAKVSGATSPTGTVAFKTNGVEFATVTLSSGVATTSEVLLPHESNSVTAEYSGDSNFLPNTNILVQLVNTPPSKGDDLITRSTGTSGTKVAISDLLTNDTDVDGDTLTITSVFSPSNLGASVQISGSWIFYTPSAAITNDDFFTYVISDGFGGTATGTVNVNIATDDNGQSQNLLPSGGTPGDFTLNFMGILGRTYSIQWAPAVDGPWTKIGEATADSNTGFGSFHDSTNHGVTAFYRTVYP